MSGRFLYRAMPADLEVRDVADGGRTVVGIAVPFGVEAEINEVGRRYRESFRRGAFARTLRERGAVKVLLQHDASRLPIGRTSVLREDPAGLYVEAPVSRTAAGDEALELIRDQVLDGFSIGFSTVPNGDRWSADRSEVERVEVRLRELSLTGYPEAAYPDARVLAVREDGTPLTPPRDVLRARLDLLERSLP